MCDAGNGTPKWMVKIREIPIKMDDLGLKTPLFLVQHPCGIIFCC